MKNNLKSFFQQLIGYNRMYRLFLLIVSFIWGGDWLTGSIFFFSLLIILDSKFRNYCLTVRRRYYQKKERLENHQRLAWEKASKKSALKDYLKWYRFKLKVKSIVNLILSKIVPYLTRLPIFELYWQDTLWHYRYRNLLKFVKALEDYANHKIRVTETDVDQYHVTYYIRLIKPLTPGKAKLKINQALKKYFGEIPGGVMIKLKRATGQILIPEELLRKN